jgi:sugar phosphate isomerase/epimerase
MHLGIFAKTFPRATVEQVFDAVAAHGLTHAQFNLACVGLPTLPDRVDEALCRRVAGAARDRGLVLAAVSGTFNLIDPDRARLDANLRRLDVLAAACPALGTSIITLCTGTRDPADMWRAHPDNAGPEAWDDLVRSVTAAVGVAESRGVTLAVEPELANVVDSAAKARRLLDEVRSPRLKVVIDPANLFPPGSLTRMRAVLDEAFALLGRDLVLAHAKDLARDGEAGREAAGTGVLDYGHYLRLLAQSGYDGPLILHGLAESQVAASVAFLRGKLAGLEGGGAERDA